MNRPKGTKDIFGIEEEIRLNIFDTLKFVAQIYGFQKVETPIFEHKDVFIDSSGEESDIVSKEMYLFKDKSNRELVLRPEGTAGVIRAIVENKLYTKLPLKIYYDGPMFRYENPQKGRQRQFTQFGVELFSEKNFLVDCEILSMAILILKKLKIPYLLKINSLGTFETKRNYSKALKEYFQKFELNLSEISKKRLEINPFRILDDKIENQKDFVKNAPKICDFYDSETKKNFEKIINFLDKSNVKYEIDYSLVRGLDYYTDIVFEFISISGIFSSQSTLIGGGRYQDLVKKFGGPNISGIGFGIGIERIMSEFLNQEKFLSKFPDVFILNISSEQEFNILNLVLLLRENGFWTEWNVKPVKLTKAFEKAELSHASIYIIAGEKELKNNSVVLKTKKEQKVVKITKLIEEIKILKKIKCED